MAEQQSPSDVLRMKVMLADASLALAKHMHGGERGTNAARWRDALSVFDSLIANVLNHPRDDKYKQLKESNQRLQQLVFSDQFAKQLLHLIGFAPDMDTSAAVQSMTGGTVWKLPAAFDPYRLRVTHRAVKLAQGKTDLPDWQQAQDVVAGLFRPRGDMRKRPREPQSLSPTAGVAPPAAAPAPRSVGGPSSGSQNAGPLEQPVLSTRPDVQAQARRIAQIFAPRNGSSMNNAMLPASGATTSEIENPEIQPPLARPLSSGLSPNPAVKDVREETAMRQKLVGCLSVVREYEKADLQATARSKVPEDILGLPVGEEKLRRLLQWFKMDFFRWVTKPSCPYCNSGGNVQQNAGVQPPQRPQEISGRASRVEIYRCSDCGEVHRFPRFNSPLVLLEWRRGRCGEWANCFCLILRACGFQTRYVLDFTDHVWAEAYIKLDAESSARWVHCDPCEMAYDSPLMYESGWGKKLNYCIGFTYEDVVDVTDRYTRNYNDVLPRRTLISEGRLAGVIAMINQSLQPYWSDTTTGRRTAEAYELAQFRELGMGRNVTSDAEKKGRQSGDQEWRSARGELGPQAVSTPGGLTSEGTVSPAINMPAFISPEFEGLRSLVALDGEDLSASMHFVGSSKPLARDAASSQGVYDGGIALTPCRNGQCGAAYYPESVDRLVSSSMWVIEFAFCIRGAVDGKSGGADGLALVLHGDARGINALGGDGSGLGYAGIRPSVAVEVDTYCTSECADPNANHIAVTSGGNPNHSTQRAEISGSKGMAWQRLPPLSNGTLYRLRVQWAAGMLSVWLTDSQQREAANFVCILQIPGASLSDLLGRNSSDSALPLFIGFTASTGGLCQAHEVLSLRAWSR